MNTRKFLSLLLFAFVALGRLNAQSNPYNLPEQLMDLIKKTFDNYPALKQGDALIKLNEEQRLLAKAGYMPTIDGEATYRYQQPTPALVLPSQFGFPPIQFFPANNYDFHLAANLPIWDFGRTAAQVKRTLVQIQTSKDNLDNSKLMLAYQVAELYVAIIFYNKSVEIQQDEVKLLQENEKIISDRLKDGDALKFDLLSTQVKRNAAENQLIDLQNNLRKNYEFLDMLTGQSGDGYITRDSISLNTEGHYDVSSDKSYQLILLNDQLAQTELDFKDARNNWMPKLTAHGQIGYQDGYFGVEDGKNVTINELLLTESVSVGLSIPIYGSDRPNYRMKIAKINAQAAKYNIEATKLNLDKDILQAKSDLAATAAKLKNYNVQIEQAKEALDLANIRYKAGVITNLELLTAQTDLQNAQLGQIQLQFQVLQSTLTLNQIGGTKFW